MPFRTKEEKAEYQKRYYVQHSEDAHARAKKYRNDNPEQVKKGLKIWRDSHKEHIKVRDRNYRLQKRYGLSEEGYRTLWEKQNGTCKVCNRILEEHVPVIDHNHMTNEVRGILCQRCNILIGLLEIDTSLANKAIRYLKGGD